MKKLITAALAITLATAASAVAIGDTQGLVSVVKVKPAVAGVKSFEVWFSQVQNDRWGCVATNGGYIIVYDNGSGVTAESFKQMFALAVLAQTTGKSLGLDSGGVSPCSNVAFAWIVP